jgi:hypothetical protein
MKDRKTFEDWQSNTEWGQLFQRYGQGESGPLQKSTATGASAEAAPT